MRTWIAPMLCAAALATAWPQRPVHAKTADTEAVSEKPKKSKQSGKGKNVAMKVTAPGGSGESSAERGARLRRECKGRPNAGACSGYTD